MTAREQERLARFLYVLGCRLSYDFVFSLVDGYEGQVDAARYAEYAGQALEMAKKICGVAKTEEETVPANRSDQEMPWVCGPGERLPPAPPFKELPPEPPPKPAKPEAKPESKPEKEAERDDQDAGDSDAATPTD